MQYEQAYLELLTHVWRTGVSRPSRAGKTRSIFGAMLRIPDLQEGYFPLLTTRRMYPGPVLGELAAFLQGYSSLEDFKKFGCNYWDANARAWPRNNNLEADTDIWLGRIYGVQWRHWRKSRRYKGTLNLDQLDMLIRGIRDDPFGRRHIVTTWRPDELDQMCLPPCHILFQCYVTTSSRLDLMVYMRSVDLCVGLPSDVVLYATLLLLIAKEVGLDPGILTFSLGDAHIYENHLDQLEVQLGREPTDRPKYYLSPVADLDEFTPDDLRIINYDPQERIQYEFNV